MQQQQMVNNPGLMQQQLNPGLMQQQNQVLVQSLSASQLPPGQIHINESQKDLRNLLATGNQSNTIGLSQQQQQQQQKMPINNQGWINVQQQQQQAPPQQQQQIYMTNPNNIQQQQQQKQPGQNFNYQNYQN